MSVFYVRGNHGALTADATTGEVLSISPAKDYDHGTYPKGEYVNIVRFDVAEWRRTYPGEPIEGTTNDILDFGFWLADGTYEAPALDWRREFGEASREPINRQINR